MVNFEITEGPTIIDLFFPHPDTTIFAVFFYVSKQH